MRAVQGYTITQVPAAPIVQKFGAKRMLGLSMLGTAAVFAGAPALAAGASTTGRKATVLMSTFMLMGLVQGTFAPAMSQINRAWLPGGIEQVWALRGIGQAHQVTPLLAALVTPRLAVKLGWRMACYVFAGATAGAALVWQLFASNAPVAAAAAAAGRPRPKNTAKKAVEWRIFRLWECQMITVNWLAVGLINYSMLNLGPIFYVSPATVGLGCGCCRAI